MARITTTSGPRACDPTSPESLNVIIKLAKDWFSYVDRDAETGLGYLEKIKQHVRWKEKLQSENNTWEDFCIEVFSRPAQYFEWVRIGTDCSKGRIPIREAAQLGKNRWEKAQAKREKILEIKETHPEATQQEVADLFQKETGEPIGQQRVSEATAEKDESSNSPVKTVAQECAETGKSKQTIDRQRKLQKTSPALYDKVVSGEMTLNAACVASGIVKKPTAYEQIKKLLNQLNQEEIEKLISELQEKIFAYAE